MLNRFVDDMLTNGGKKGLGLSSTTMQSVMILLRSVLEYGELEYGLSNAAKHISLPKVQKDNITVFNEFEVRRIRNCADLRNSIELGIVLTLFTGLRIGELCALTWEDIDIAEQLIHVRKMLFRIANQGHSEQKTAIVIDSPKSKSSLRDVPIPTFLLEPIASLKSNQDSLNYFLTCSSRPDEPRTYTERYKSFLRRIGVSYRNFHSLRHTFVSRLMERGVNPYYVQRAVGHSTMMMTAHYDHSAAEEIRKALDIKTNESPGRRAKARPIGTNARKA